MTKDEEIAALKAAFQEFSESSAILTQSYNDLHEQAVILSERLALAEKQKRAEEQKNRLLLEQFQQLFQSMPVGVLLLSAEGLVIMANTAALTLFDLSVVGMPWSLIVPQCFAPQKDDGHEVTMVSGRRVRVETSSLGDAPGQLIILVDLTETHKLQKQLAHHERLSNMGTMVAALAHQIRTPLSTATLYAGHLQNPLLSEALRDKFSSKLMGRLQHIERQIRDMLIFSKSDIRLDTKLILNDFLLDLVSSSEEICEQRNAVLEVVLPSNMQAYLLQCNKDTLIGALHNLLNNSIDAQDEGGTIRLHCGCDNDAISIDFIDSGVGMTDEQLQKIQDGFVTTKQHGTGLGIMVVKAVARAHHGQFEIQSEQGKGTLARVLLPLIKV